MTAVDSMLLELAPTVVRALHDATGVALIEFGEDCDLVNTTAEASAPGSQQGEPAGDRAEPPACPSGSPGFDGVLDEVTRRGELIASVLTYVVSTPTPLWGKFFPQYLRRARVERFEQMSSELLAILERDTALFASQHGTRA